MQRTAFQSIMKPRAFLSSSVSFLLLTAAAFNSIPAAPVPFSVVKVEVPAGIVLPAGMRRAVSNRQTMHRALCFAIPPNHFAVILNRSEGRRGTVLPLQPSMVQTAFREAQMRTSRLHPRSLPYPFSPLCPFLPGFPVLRAS